jgi:hypothetical protein
MSVWRGGCLPPPPQQTSHKIGEAGNEVDSATQHWIDTATYKYHIHLVHRWKKNRKKSFELRDISNICSREMYNKLSTVLSND